MDLNLNKTPRQAPGVDVTGSGPTPVIRECFHHDFRSKTGDATSEYEPRAQRSGRSTDLAAAGLIQQVSVEIVEDLESLKTLRDAWSRLSSNALEQNILLDPEVALAAAAHIDTSKRVGFVLVWRKSRSSGEAPGDLIGLFPVTNMPLRWGLPIRGIQAWEHIHCFLTTPLLDRHHARLAAESLFHWLSENRGRPRFLLCQLIGRNAVWDTMHEVLSQHENRYFEFGPRERAMLKTNLDGDKYLRLSLGRKRNKEYRRLRNRLADNGEVCVAYAERPDEIERATARFLELEARGWKGKRGTALNASDGGHRFLSDSLDGLANEGRCRIAELMLGDAVIASVLVVTSGRTAWIWKIAYDECYSRYSPGVLLVLDLTKNLIEDPKIEYTDSCAMPDHPMINHIWRERFAITDVLIELRPGIVPAHLVARMERCRRWLRAQLKSLYLKYFRR